MQKLFSIETYLGPLLMRYIGKYVKLRDDQFQLSLWGGDAVLNYLELQYDIFEYLMPLPLGFKSGHIHELRIQVPWTRLGSSSIVITLNTVECVLALKRSSERRQTPRSEGEIPTVDTLQPPSYLHSYLTRIWSNIEVVVNNLIVKFVEDDIVISLNIPALDCFRTLVNWKRGIEAPSVGNYCLHRLLKITDMTLCIDRCDAKGHINTYQDPVIYRHSFAIRLQMIFNQNNNGLASICIANLFGPQLMEINLSQVQIPLIARILEILFALSNKIIRWEAISDHQVIGNQGIREQDDVLGNNEKGIIQTQSWFQWAWSFAPFFYSYSPSEDHIYESCQDDSSVEYIKKLNSCEARAEYVRLLYEDAIEPSDEPPQTSNHRRNCLSRLRKYQKSLPALVLGVLIKKTQIHVKTYYDSYRLGFTYTRSSTAKNLRRNRLLRDLFTITIQDLGFQFVQDGQNFTSFQGGAGLMNISPAGEACPCGIKQSIPFLPHDLLTINSNFNRADGGDNADALIRTFCGLFGADAVESNDVVGISLSDKADFVCSQPLVSGLFVLPPLCRKDYHKAYGAEDQHHRLSLGVWIESIFSQEGEEDYTEDGLAFPQEPKLHSFKKFLLEDVEINLNLAIFHRLQHFLQILTEGSRNYQACCDWNSHSVLPQQAPVDGWLLRERMICLRRFTPIQVNRTKIRSLRIEIPPPTHDLHVANRSGWLQIEMNSIDVISSSPLEPIKLVFTMTHLYPSSGVLVEVNSSFFNSSSAEDIMDSKNCDGKVHQSVNENVKEEKKVLPLFTLDEGNQITKSLQVDLLNKCYTSQRVKISKMSISLGQVEQLAPLSITLALRNRLFSGSWPSHLSDGLVITERYITVYPQIQLTLNSYALRSLSAYGFYMASHVGALSSALSSYFHNETWSEASEYSGQLKTVEFVNYTIQNTDAELPFLLNFQLRGTVFLHIQSGINREVTKTALVTSMLMGNLMKPPNKIVPIFECSSSGPEFIYSCDMEKKIVPPSSILCPASMTLKFAPIKLLISSSLVGWFNDVIRALKRAWKGSEIEPAESPPDVILDSKSQTSLSLHQVDLHKPTSDEIKPFLDVVSTRHRPTASKKSYSVLFSDPSTSPSLTFSEWIISNCTWFTTCKVEISISPSTLCLAPTNHHFSTGDIDQWLSSLDQNTRDKTVWLILPRIEIRGPRSASSPSQSPNAAPSPPPATGEETNGIRLYSFETEKNHSEVPRGRLSQISSASEVGYQALRPNYSMWECSVTGMRASLAQATHLLHLNDVVCGLSVIVSKSQSDNLLSNIAWNIVISIGPNRKSTSNEAPSLRHILQFLATVSEMQAEISNFVGEIVSTKEELVASWIRKSKADGLSVEVAQLNGQLFDSAKKSSSLLSPLSSSSSYSLSNSRRALLPPPKISSVGVQKIPVSGTVKITLPSAAGELCLTEKQSELLWEVEALSIIVSTTDCPLYFSFRLQLQHMCLSLRTMESSFPLITPKHWHFKPFQNIIPCPGSEYYDEPKVDQRRPKPRDPLSTDSDTEADSAPSPHIQPASLFTISFVHSPVGLVRRIFAGKRFYRWLDKKTEQFFQNDEHIVVDNVAPPFINCFYVRLKPLDMNICPQLVWHLKDALKEFHTYERSVFTDDNTTNSVGAPLPGHCMPLIFVAFDELRIFIPSSGLLLPLSKCVGLCDTLAITLRTVRIHSFPAECISSRLESAATHPRAVTLTSRIGSSREDRQLAFHFEGFACWAVSLQEVLNFSEGPHPSPHQPALAGQYPAFEWNQAANSLDDVDAVWVLPVLRPLDIMVLFAAPVCENNLIYGQKRVLFGSTWEVNVNHDFVVTLDTSFLSTYLSNLLSLSGRQREQEEPTKVHETSCTFQSRFLLTCGLMRFVLWRKREHTESQWDFSVIDFFQPHLRWSPDTLTAGINDLQIHLRTFVENSGYNWEGDVLWTPTSPLTRNRVLPPPCLPLPRVAEVGHLCPFNLTGVVETSCFSTYGDNELFLLALSRQEPKEEQFRGIARIQRDISILLKPTMLRCLLNLATAFHSPDSSSHSAAFSSDAKPRDLHIVATFDRLQLDTRSIAVRLVSGKNEMRFATESIKSKAVIKRRRDWTGLEAELRVTSIDTRLNDFQLTPAGTEISFRACTQFSPLGIPITIANVRVRRGTRLVIPFGEDLKRLLEAFAFVLQQNNNRDLKVKQHIHHSPPRHVFVDDLRKKSAYDFSSFVSTGSKGLGDISRLLPLPYEIIFADCDQFSPEVGAEGRFATMTWTFPEPRQPVRLVLNPVPFFYDNDFGGHGNIMVPARLQYWDDNLNEYGGFATYAAFDLCEDVPVDVVLPPLLTEFSHCMKTVEQAQKKYLLSRSSIAAEEIFWGTNVDPYSPASQPVAATSWRIIVSCFGRTTTMSDSASSKRESASIPVFLAPSALAACTHLDSAYIPEISPPLSLNVGIDDFCFSVWEVSNAGFEIGRLTFSKLHVVLAILFANQHSEGAETASEVDQLTNHDSPALLKGFSASSIAAHVFSPHGAHLQLLGEVERVFGMSGFHIFVGRCHLCCSSDLLYALARIMRGEGEAGWTISNRTNKKILVEQHFSIESDNPATRALLEVTSVALEAGQRFKAWRPIVLPKTHMITLKVVLSTGPKAMVRSAPLSIPWPPNHTTNTCARLTQWVSASGPSDFLPRASLIIPPRTSSGPPGEVIIQPSLTLENDLPFEVELRFPDGSSEFIASSSSCGFCTPQTTGTTDLLLSAAGADGFVSLGNMDLTGPEGEILWLPVAKTVCPVLLQVTYPNSSVPSDGTTLVKIAPPLNVTNVLPMPLTLVLDDLGESESSFLTSCGQGFSRNLDIPKGFTTHVVIAFPSNAAPALSFHYPDNTPIFESSLFLPWRTLSGRLDVVVQPWLLLRNHSSMDLQVFTASNLERICLPDESGASLDAGSCLMPAVGERLFRIGIKHKFRTVWSHAFLVHKSVFAPPPTPSAAGSAAITLMASGLPRTPRRGASDDTAVRQGEKTLITLTRARGMVSLALPLGRVICCLAVRLHLVAPHGVITVTIEPLLCVNNRTRQTLLCKPIAAPIIRDQSSLPLASVDELEAEVITLPSLNDSPTPLLFWNYSHPELAFKDVDLDGMTFAHLLVLSSHLGVFWSRSLHLGEVLSTDGGQSLATAKPYHRYYHISLPHSDESANANECSFLLTLSNESQSGLWTLHLETLPPSLSYSLGCSLTNMTDSLFEATFHDIAASHQFPVSNAMPCVHPNGGKLLLIPQTLLDQLAGKRIIGETAKPQIVSNFLFHEDTELLLRLHTNDVAIKLSDCRDKAIMLKFGDKMFLIQQVKSETMSFLMEVVLFTDLLPVLHRKPHIARPLSLSVCVQMVLIFSFVPGSLLLQGDVGLKKFLRFSIQCVEAVYAKEAIGNFSQLNLTSSLMQIDNLAQLSPSTFDFPVLLRSVLPPIVGESDASFFSCICQIRHLSARDFILDRLELRLPSFDGYFEDGMLYSLASWVRDLRGAWPVVAGEDIDHVLGPSPLTMLCLRQFQIHPVSLELALKVQIKVHISCKTTKFQLNGFTCSDAVLEVQTLMALLSAHYISQVLIRAGLVLGGLELIGNPACLVTSFAQGVWDLLHLADCENVGTQEQLGLLRGLARGLVSLMKHTTGGVCSSVTGLASSIARNLHELSLDTEHIQRITETRQRHQPSGLGSGLALGLSELGVSLLSGLAGLAHHPLFSLPPPPSFSAPLSPQPTLAHMAEALVAGVGRGIVGLVTKPLAGVADLVAFSGKGFMQGMDTSWGISPPPKQIVCLTISPNSSYLVDAVLLHKWSHTLMRCLNFPPTQEYLWAGLGTDANHTLLTWFCLPIRDSLFTIEFNATVPQVRSGVIPVDVVASNEEEIEEVSVNTTPPTSGMSIVMKPCQLSFGDKVVLKHVIRRTENKTSDTGNDGVSNETNIYPHWERIKTYLSGLPHLEEDPEKDGCV